MSFWEVGGGERGAPRPGCGERGGSREAAPAAKLPPPGPWGVRGVAVRVKRGKVLVAFGLELGGFERDGFPLGGGNEARAFFWGGVLC